MAAEEDLDHAGGCGFLQNKGNDDKLVVKVRDEGLGAS